MKLPRMIRCAAAALAVIVLTSCGKKDDEAPPATPKEAAVQLEKAFQAAPDEAKQAIVTASEAMRQGDFEKAVVSLQVARARKDVTLDQGLAIHHSLVTMESKLVSAMDTGDANARRAYELLKQIKRK